jgi:hypothetical protein
MKICRMSLETLVKKCRNVGVLGDAAARELCWNRFTNLATVRVDQAQGAGRIEAY